ncbi:MoaD/ThiS family protein [Georgenia sp. SYP-B2076]|uniref:MoaD/ThiS family protein n=1 Tax=Georgenia sp. SYP-B2076 TaxID=2495881 RepID=UPI001F0BD1FC|nr:MoaD/ThiS family protein [Georgenia sp. SYP-B2076]
MSTTTHRPAGHPGGVGTHADAPALTVHVRYFAGAAEAAGAAAETLALPAGATAADLLAAIRAAHGPAVGRVLEISSLLVDGTVREDHAAPLGAAATTVVGVDVLPPFAGG